MALRMSDSKAKLSWPQLRRTSRLCLVNGKIGKVDFGERNLTDYLANQEVTASSGELQMREAMPSQAGKGWIGSKGRPSPSHTHEIEPTYTE